MKMEPVLADLEAAATKLGVKVSYEVLAETVGGGGLCKVKGTYRVIIEKRGTTGFVIRRRPFGGQAGAKATGSAAATRWRAASAPSEPPAGEFGLGAPRFTAVLERCRGGRPGAWLFEAKSAYSQEGEAWDGTHPLRLVADLGDRQLAPAASVRAA